LRSEHVGDLSEHGHRNLVEKDIVLASGLVDPRAPSGGIAFRAVDGFEHPFPDVGDFHQMTPRACSAATSWRLSARSCCNTAAVCWPRGGGAARTDAGVSESLIGTPSRRSGPIVACSARAIISRAAIWGSLNTSCRSRTDPHGTPAFVSPSIH